MFKSDDGKAAQAINAALNRWSIGWQSGGNVHICSVSRRAKYLNIDDGEVAEWLKAAVC